MSRHGMLPLTAAVLLALGGGQALAADPMQGKGMQDTGTQAQQQGGDKAMGRQAGAGSMFDARTLKLSEEMIGKPVINQQQEQLGTIEELVADRAGVIQYVLLSPAEDIQGEQGPIALPWHALAASTAKDKYLLPMSKDMLAQAPRFGQAADLTDQQAAAAVHEFYGVVFVPAETVAFARFDADADGVISKDEIGQNEVLKEHFQQADANNDGQLDRGEFAAFEVTIEEQPQEGAGAQGQAGGSGMQGEQQQKSGESPSEMQEQ